MEPMAAAGTLRAARRRAGLSLRALAKRAQTSHATLAAYESGAKVPRVDTITRIVRAAGFALDLELATRPVADDRAARGRELVAALELAAQFPSRHRRAISSPPFRAMP
jgi:transcriptional regulator with XRE-family HTH domain